MTELYCRKCRKKTGHTLNFEIPFERQEWRCLTCNSYVHLITKSFAYHEPKESPEWIKKLKTEEYETEEDSRIRLFKQWGRIGRFMFKVLGKKAYRDSNGVQWYYAKSIMRKMKVKKERRDLEKEVREGFLILRRIVRAHSLTIEGLYPESSFLFFHGIRGKQKEYIQSDRTQLILRNWGFGADVQNRFKNTEELVEVLRTLYVIFDFNASTLATYIHRYVKKHYENVGVLRKILEQEFGLERPFYGLSLNWRERLKGKKVIKEIMLGEAISDLRAFLSETKLQETTKDGILKWMYSQPHVLRDLGSKIQKDSNTRSE